MTWLDKRISHKKMLVDRSGLAILAARVEGNLLAAAQEIEKLHILYGPVKVTDEMIRQAVADNARFDVYDLAEAAMSGHAVRAHRVLAGLRSEGVADAVALWALARDIRYLSSLKSWMNKGDSIESAFAKQKERLWGKRQSSLISAANRLSLSDAHQALLLCTKADRTIKGMETGDAWEVMLDICMSVAGIPFATAVVR
jgi:DNA polymerase-3 subunit delta